jgi:hypothetical protein
MFRFTIRDVLWLTVVVAAVISWLMTARAKQRFARDLSRKEAEAKLAQMTLEAQQKLTKSVMQQLVKATVENRRLEAEIAARQEELDLEQLIRKGYLPYV